MVVLKFIPMTSLLKWVLLVSLVSSSLGLKISTRICDRNDLLGLKEFAGNLTNTSLLSSLWSNDSICCKWAGVVCENMNNRVIELILPNMGLKGMISHSLGQLDHLNSLNLSCNSLEGGLPESLSNLKQLKVLDFSQNKLSGPIFDPLSGMVSLQILNISGNSFTGKFYSRICHSSNRIRVLDISKNSFSGNLLGGLENCSSFLQQFHADSNLLEGKIPDSFYSLSALERVSLSGNNLYGELSRELSKLSSLKSFIISGNQFSGEIPNVFQNLTKLEELNADSNLFTGKLPSTLSLCSTLKVINLRNNSLRGHIDLDFTRLHSLCTLDLGSNHFYGSLPISLSNCPELQILSLARNELVGQIPESYAKFKSLWFLSLSKNSFVGLNRALSILQQCKNLSTMILTKNFHREDIPVNVTGFENLVLLALGNCGLRGPIPIWLLHCKRLSILDLSWNQLNGSIPSWIGQMENLFYLDLTNNSLSGEIPKSMNELKSLIFPRCRSSNLTTFSGIPLIVKRNRSSSGLQYKQASSFPPSIFLSNNRINGTIRPEIGNLKQLHVLDLSRNNISGTIPSSISDMGNLEVLDLSNNDLSGSIPPLFNKLTFLSTFSVANNHLSGAIPSGGQFLIFPSSSFEGNPGLCGEIDSPCSSSKDSGIKPEMNKTSSRHNKLSTSTILGITFGIGIGVALILVIFVLVISRKGVGSIPIGNFDEEFSRPRRLSEAHRFSKLVLFQNSECKDLTVMELLKSTGNFNQENIIGCGGFGLVYRAEFRNGSKAAVKRLLGDCGQMEREFQAEVEALSRAQHDNLVSLQGYCLHGNDRLLIYSYMENGSLDYWLHEHPEKEGPGSSLKWEVRVKIALDSARGLAYLHKECDPSIIHRDVKSSNILLSRNFKAHLADFGLSRLLQPYDTHVTTELVGTLGYIPPEYSQTLCATLRGDVYSFGVVLLELSTGRRPVEVGKGKNCRDLVSWVDQMKSERREEEIVDTAIWDKPCEKELLEVLGIACRCIDLDPRRRPLIEEVVAWLDDVQFRVSQQKKC